VPYSEAWFDFYEDRWATLIDDEGNCPSGVFDIPLAVIDRAIERFEQEEAGRA
jgi:hypothetical protein